MEIPESHLPFAMHRARFVNPFDARYDGAVVTVTRRDVFSPPPDVLPPEETADDLRQLNKLVRARVDVDLEHSPRPAKRRKLSQGAAAPSVSFRLFAQSDAREISLVPKEHPARKRELPVEDTSHERKTRRERAQQCAIGPPAASPSLPSARQGQTRALRLSSAPAESPELPRLFVASVPKQSPSLPRNPKLDWTHATERPSKPVSCCPTLSTSAQPPGEGTKRRRRRRPAERAPPAFWRPPPDLGGKSAGYALGWPASAPGPGAVRYVRCGKHTLSAFS